MSGIPLLPPTPVGFPDPSRALDEPDGLLAAGGALTPEWLIEAYARGIFPWFDSDDEHVLWWSPRERAVLVPGEMHVSKSLRKRITNAGFTHTFDEDFRRVIEACQAPRKDASGTWITENMRDAYTQLHHLGLAHSVEVQLDGELVGGLYGVSLGRLFFGESMFSRANDASKVAFYHLQFQLADWEFLLIDCQLMNPHLERLGVHAMAREEFLEILTGNPLEETRRGRWSGTA
jgi:leucyl/phenylalanyl-tRNA--protein transferase